MGERAESAPSGDWPAHSEPHYPQPAVPVPARGRADGSGRSSGSRHRRSGWRSTLILAAVALGLAGLIASAVGIMVKVLPRRFTAAQQQEIIAWEIGKRWRTWPASRIFPAAVSYQLSSFGPGSGAGVSLTAHRIGIASQASCGSATDPPVARVLAAHGCVAVLRATYEDATGALAVTVGVAVLPGPASASASRRALPSAAGGPLGIRPVPFAGTLAAQFGDAQRQLSSVSSAGAYLIMSTVGYSDGRGRVQGAADPYTKDEMLSVEHGIGNLVGARLGAVPPPPRCPGAPGC
jgi:hypothetical protein